MAQPDQLDQEIAAIGAAVFERLARQDDQIQALVELLGEREQRFGEFLERVEGAAGLFRDSVRELRREW